MGGDLMGAEIALYNDPFEGDFIEKAWGLASRVSKTSFVPDVFRNKPEEVLSAILSGREIGIGPMQSLQKINVIKGKPTQSAELMRALVQSKGHEIWTEDYNTTRVILCGKRAGSENVNKVTWTMDDAKRAKLDGKDNWRLYPRAMLLARATGELCRLMFADVLGGISYTPEEIEDGLLEAMPVAELVAAAEGDTGQPKAITRKAAPAKKTAAKRTATQVALGTAPLPPLPGEEDEGPPVPPTPESSSPADDEVVKQRAQMIAMRCAEAGLDDDGRHRLISAVTNGVKDSARTVDASEGADVLAALVEIRAGRKALQQDGNEGGWWLVDVEDSTDDEATLFVEPDVGDAAAWSQERWREYLAIKGVTRTELLREANRLCLEAPADLGDPPPTVGDLAGRESLCALLVGFVEDHADPEREF
jgi:hypothetical protein